jgi:CHAD domain-containing protein
LPKAPFLARVGRKRLDRFLDCLRAAAKRPAEAEVHDLRVSIRRLLAFLELAAGMPGAPPPPPDLPRALRSLMRPLGRLRDAHVKLIHLSALCPAVEPESWKYVLSVKGDEERWEAVVTDTLGVSDRDRFRARFGAIRFSSLPKGNLRSPALSLLLRREREVDRRIADFRRERTPESLHSLRLAFKAYRYSAEAMAPFLPDFTPEAEARLHDLQTLLGDIRDFDLLLAAVRRFREKVLGLRPGGGDIAAAVGAERKRKLRRLHALLRAEAHRGPTHAPA